eukprot:gene12943-17352_t
MNFQKLDDQIDIYAHESCNPSDIAQNIFTSFNETDIDKKLKELEGLQIAIEEVLKKKVRSNYVSFLQTTEQITRVGSEMVELKHLVDNTQKLIEDVRKNQINESDAALKANSLLANLHNKQMIESQEKSKANGNHDKIPLWYINAPADLARFMVEQQYSEAVDIIHKVRLFSSTIENGNNKSYLSTTVDQQLSSSDHSTILSVVKNINEKKVVLVSTIQKSLSQIPCSQLWGVQEQLRRLKLLIALGEFNLAAEGFSSSQVNGIKKVLRDVEVSGDTLTFTTELSHSFFLAISDASTSFLHLFGEHCEKPTIMSLLLVWIQGQVSAFAEVLSRQILLGINEYAAIIIIQLRQTASNDQQINNDFAMEMNQEQQIIQRKIDIASQSGSLTFAASCLEVVYRESKKLDSHRLIQCCTPCLGYVLLPEIQKFVRVYADEFIKEIENQVRQDSWALVYPQHVDVRSPAEADAQYNLTDNKSQVISSNSTSVMTSLSYDWMVLVFIHFCDELWVLIKAQDGDKHQKSHKTQASSGQNSNNSTPSRSLPPRRGSVVLGQMRLIETSVSNDSYSRADICEVEPTATACLLRMLLRYVSEIEETDTKGFTRKQLDCFLQTLKAITTHLIPTLQMTIETCFFHEGLNLISTQNATSQNLFKSLIQRIQKLQNEKMSQNSNS